MSVQSHLLVTGAAGHLGRRVIEALVDAGARNVTAASRDPARIADLAAKGVAARRADFDDPACLDAAFAGVERLLIVSTDAIDAPGKRLRQHKAAVAAAARAGVQHLVYTSMPNPEPGSVIPFAPDHHETEQAIIASGLPHTILRVNWYMENLLHALPPVLAAGKWFTAAGEGRVGHVARDDVARAAAAALLTETGSKRYDITGPQALTVAEMAAVVGEVFGKPIAVVPVTDAQLQQGLEAHSVPAAFASLLTAFDANTRAGRVDITADAVRTLTGRAPVGLREFLLANRAALTHAA
jgi:NAD(P)H dehydrogenase (quinone)